MHGFYLLLFLCATKTHLKMAGQNITVQNGILKVPDFPIFPFIEGDGTGTEIINNM